MTVARLDYRLHEGDQALLGNIQHLSHPNPPDGSAAAPLSGDRDDDIVERQAPDGAEFNSADIRLANLDLVSEPISARSHHRAAKLVQPSPGRLVAAQAEHPLQAKGADALLLVGHVPGGGEPGPERTPRVLEDRPRRDRGLSGSLRGRLLLAGQVKDIRLGVDQPFIRRLPVRASSRHSRRR